MTPRFQTREDGDSRVLLVVRFRLIRLFIVEAVPIKIVCVYEEFSFNKFCCVQVLMSLKQAEMVREESVISGLVDI